MVTDHLDTQSTLHFLVMEVLRLDLHLSTRWWRQQTTIFCDDRPVMSPENGAIAFAEISVHEEYVDSHPKTVNNSLDLENNGLKVAHHMSFFQILRCAIRQRSIKISWTPSPMLAEVGTSVMKQQSFIAALSWADCSASIIPH